MTMDYDANCKAAATDQGLDPITEILTAAGVEFYVENTGGWCMCVVIPAPNGVYAMGGDVHLHYDPTSTVGLTFYPGSNWYEGESEGETWTLTAESLALWAHSIAQHPWPSTDDVEAAGLDGTLRTGGMDGPYTWQRVAQAHAERADQYAAAIRAVVAAWDGGDLAGAVNDAAALLPATD